METSFDKLLVNCGGLGAFGFGKWDGFAGELF